MTIELFAAFCLTEAVLCFTPGPAVLLVVSIALGQGVRPSLGAAAGIVAANTLYFVLSAAGVAALLLASRELFLVVKWIGAGYLVYLGVRLLFARGEAGTPRRSGAGRVFVRGFVVQGANPKAIAFFVALLPQFVDATRPLAPQLIVLAVASVVIEVVALGTYAYAAARTGRLFGPRVVRAVERVGGGLLIAAGAKLATVEQD